MMATRHEPHWTSVACTAAWASVPQRPRSAPHSVRRGGGDGYKPLNETEYCGPPHIQAQGGVRPILLRYAVTAYLINARTKVVFSMIVSSPGATTRAGVGVGDPLSLVRKKYNHVVCGKQVAGDRKSVV